MPSICKPVPPLLLCSLSLLHLQAGYAWSWPFGSSGGDPIEFQHDHIRSLTKSDFEEHVMREDGRYYFVKFYANWCGHCKTMAPRWAEVAAENNSSDIEFLQVECSRNNNLCRKAAVKGFPEIKVFYNGRIGYEATGSMDLEGLRSFVKEVPGKVEQGFKKARAAGVMHDDDKRIKKASKPGKESPAHEL